MLIISVVGGAVVKLDEKPGGTLAEKHASCCCSSTLIKKLGIYIFRYVRQLQFNSTWPVQ